MCEDYPCCGHEAGDCEGRKYGTSEGIAATDAMFRRSGWSEEEIDAYWDGQV